MRKCICIIMSFLIILTNMPSVFAKVTAYDDNGKYIYRNNTFDFPLLGDPMNVTDEEFFGKWDSASQTWSEGPWFNYDEYPEMILVEEAAKSGDYSLAKEELLNYYLPKQRLYMADSSTYTSMDRTIAELLCRNFYANQGQNGYPRAIIGPVSNEWTTVDVDLTNEIVSLLNNGQYYATYVIASIDKSNTPGEIMSKESDSAPVLTVVANGVTKVIPACEDSYIQAGNGRKANYGSSPILYSQEYGYTGHWDGNNLSGAIHELFNKELNDWGDESTPTRRPYLKFDLRSNLDPSDTITSATMSIKIRTSPGDEYDLKEKEFLVYEWANSNWSENTVCWDDSSFASDWLFFSANDQDAWDYATTTNTTTKGKLGAYAHRGNAITPAASMFKVTGTEKYAHAFLRQMMAAFNGIGKKYEACFNALDMSGHIRRMGSGFINCWNSKSMTPEVFTAAIKEYSRMTDYVMNTWIYPKTYYNNWATYCTLAAYSMGLIYPELKQSETWVAAAQDDNKDLFFGGSMRGNTMHVGLMLEDGFCVELGLGYVRTLLGTFSSPISLQQYAQSDISAYDEEATEGMKKMVKNLLYQNAPGWNGFNLADSMDANDSETMIKTFDTWNKLLFNSSDDELLYAITDGKRGEKPGFTSISYPCGLRTYMRDGWEKDSVSLAFTAKGAGSHGHKDTLSVAMWAYGKFLLTDQSYGSTLTGDIRDYMISPAQHNVVTVNDGAITIGAAGKTELDGVEKEQEINNLHNFTTYSATTYQGADLNQRSVMFLKQPKFYIITDYIVPNDKTSANTYTQFWHMLPESNIYITDDSKKEFRSNFDNGANVIVSPVDPGEFSDVRIENSIYAPTDGSFIDSHKGVYEKKQFGTTTYSTIIYPEMQGGNHTIDTENIDVGISDNGASAFYVRITDNNTNEFADYYYYHLNDVSQKKEVKIGKYTTDATALLVEEDKFGNFVSVFVYDASYLISDDIQDKYIFKSTDGTKTLSFANNGGSMIEISTDVAVNGKSEYKTLITENDLGNTTFYAGNATGAYFNGKVMSSAKKDGVYMYFGDSTIVDSTEEPSVPAGGGISGAPSLGGGGGGVLIKPVPDNDDNKGDDNKTDVDDPNIKPDEGDAFSDVDKNMWAFECIEKLRKAGVVTGDENKNFKPFESVKREEFLKMIMEALDVDTSAEDVENAFEDVSDDAWYTKYILASKKYGIVTGISENIFGISQNITRQDMAVIISRILDNVSVSSSDNNMFDDSEQISDYALDAVYKLKNLGIIKGYDGLFNPKDNLTRAEAASVVSAVMDFLETIKKLSESDSGTEITIE